MGVVNVFYVVAIYNPTLCIWYYDSTDGSRDEGEQRAILDRLRRSATSLQYKLMKITEEDLE